MRFWVDVEDAFGNRLGDGPLLSVTSFEQVARLDRAGTGRLSLSPADPRADLITPKRVLRCRTLRDGAVVDLGAFIVERISVSVRDGRAQMEVAGDDLLRELTYRSVHNLQLFSETATNIDKVWEHEIDTTVDPPTHFYNDRTPPSSMTLLRKSQYALFGHSAPFAGLTFTLTTVNDNYDPDQGILDGWGYSDGDNNWPERELESNGTAIAPAQFAQSGTVRFVRQSSWVREEVNGVTKYWARWDPMVRLEEDGTTDTATLDAIGYSDIDALVLGPSTDDVATVMDFAPGGWALAVGAGLYSSTTNGTYLDFAGETVLAALVKLAELAGEHFRLGTGSTVEWLRTGQTASGLRAIQSADTVAVEGNDAVCLITHISRVTDSYDLVTRVYATGAGNGAERLTLEEATVTFAGYTIDEDADGNWYIEADAEAVTYGQIERLVSFPEIASVDNAGIFDATAANQLARAAWAYLESHKAPYVSYRLSVTKVEQALKVGDTIRVIYRGVNSDGEWLDIDANLVILETTTQVDASGARTVALQVASVALWATDDNLMLAKQVSTALAYTRHTQPTSGAAVRGTVPGALTTNVPEGASVYTSEDVDTVLEGYQPLDADLTVWAGKTAPSGTVVGTTDTQTLSNKTIAEPLTVQGAAATDGSDPVVAVLHNTTSGLWTNGATMAVVRFHSDDTSGSGAGSKAEIIAHVDGTSGDAVGLDFYTKIASAALARRVRITSNGSVLIGDGVAALATTATDGFLYIPSCAGVPTGVPTARTGVVPIVYDTTNSRLYVRTGGAWVAIT